LGKRGPYFTVESFLGPKRVTFEVLRTRLVQLVKLRVNNGEFTERGLARILGISQSQAHNVLKGARLLQVQLADRMLAKLGLSATDLFSEDELDAALRLKMGEWDPQFAGNEETGLPEFDLPGAMAPKKPAAREQYSNRSGKAENGIDGKGVS
jgi:transcriptional regulator with XRE-family HTH domain